MNQQQWINKYWSLVFIIILTPILLFAVIHILPTHDDWTGTTTPTFDTFFVRQHFLFYGYHWRPFDTWIGWFVGHNPQLLYPTFNHILVVLGHTFCSFLIFRLLTLLNFSQSAKNMTTIAFFVLPATIATTTAIDSQNQTYALLFGITSFIVYVSNKKAKYLLWIILVFIATWWKENGLMWALICPILAFGFDFIQLKTLKRDILIGIGIMVCYALAIILLPKDITIHPDYVPDEMKIVKNIIKFFFTTFITTDYIYLLHKPSQNIPMAVFTFVLTLPLIYYLFLSQIKCFINKKIISVLFCLVIAAGPHILTVYSMMHTYAGLAMIAIIIAYGIDGCYTKFKKPVMISFLLFMCSAFMIDIHLIDESIQSGIIGKKMAQEAIQKTGKPVDSVYVIIIEDDYPKLSSFCVIPNEAFGWGQASRYETNYQWPKNIKDTTIIRTPKTVENAYSLGRKQLKKWDCIWIVNHQQIDVINK